MRIHSDTLTESDFYNARRAVALVAPNTYLADIMEHGSRSRARAFDVALRGDGARHTRRPMHGGTGFAATYDDWGYWLAELFRRDPNARVASIYNGRDDFHERTAGAFLSESELADRCGGAIDCPPTPAPVVR